MRQKGRGAHETPTRKSSTRNRNQNETEITTSRIFRSISDDHHHRIIQIFVNRLVNNMNHKANVSKELNERHRKVYIHHLLHFISFHITLFVHHD
ncbi:hypothetical protein HanHA300_Chr05g0184371 [Helianthus annuus]|nr:hypothetical protein HanHA300_Chr05g0184371 [Helianthus annuus]